MKRPSLILVLVTLLAGGAIGAMPAPSCAQEVRSPVTAPAPDVFYCETAPARHRHAEPSRLEPEVFYGRTAPDVRSPGTAPAPDVRSRGTDPGYGGSVPTRGPGGSKAGKPLPPEEKR